MASPQLPQASGVEPVSPLAIPIFRAVWTASLVSNFGGLIQSVGAAWMMTSLTSSPEMVALVQASTALPIMLLSLLAGAIADNRDRRRVMLAAQGAMMLISLSLAVAAWLGVLTPWVLIGFTFLLGCGAAFSGPSWQASVGDMVPRPVLPAAVALNAMNFNIARSLGPALGGVVVAVAGAATAFAINAASYVGLIVVLLRWRPQLPPRRLPPEPLLEAMAAGVRYVSMSPGIRVVMLRAVAFGLAASAIPALMPLVARDIVAGGPLTFGALLGAFGAGAVAAALLTHMLRERFSIEQIVRAAVLLVAAGAGVAALSPWLLLTMAALALAGAGWVLALANFNITVQMSAPRWVVGRALALYQMAAFGGMAAGAWMFGRLAEAETIHIALLCASGLMLAGGLIGFWRPLPALDDVNLDLLSLWQEPETAVPVTMRSGPIAVTIEYRIAPENADVFLDVMSERRRIRRRDGARRWSLLRDLAEPLLWIERYETPTWLDYVRHNQRRTHADIDNWERIRALHLGPETPRVRRMIERQTGSLPAGPAPGVRDLAPAMTETAITGTS